MSVENKINYAIETKALIKSAIESMGVVVPENATLRDYADLIKKIGAVATVATEDDEE